MAINNDKRQRRWVFTINNPIFEDSSFKEVNIENTPYEIVDDFYDTRTINKPENRCLFEFRYVEKYFEKENIIKIVCRPFFKDLSCIEKYVKNLNPKYAIYQYERGENGTPHIQGFIVYSNSKRFINVKQDFLTAHISPAEGPNLSNRAYCTKTETRIAAPVEIGEYTEMRSRTDIINLLEELSLGATNMDIKKSFPTLYSQFGPDKLERFRQDELQAKYSTTNRDVEAYFIYGDTRLGKTSYIYQNYSNSKIYRVTNYNSGSFDSYRNQEILVLDEFTGKMDITFLNNILDRYPLELPARYSNKTACFNKVYIISNLPLNKLYQEEQLLRPEVYRAFVSRFIRIIHFTEFGKFHYENVNGTPLTNT
ncbi:MAG: hypothetical protein J1F18_10780 [Lachnospiraceae bacterium]|nr:hypothetical protein [Lachnospiraceae bacterium]